MPSCWGQVNCSYFSPGRYETSIGEKWETDDKHCGALLLAGTSFSVGRMKNKNLCTHTAILVKIRLMNRTDRMNIRIYIHSHIYIFILYKRGNREQTEKCFRMRYFQ